MECEICGEKSSIAYEVIFQGKRVYACNKCIDKYGLSVIRRRGSSRISKSTSKRRGVMKIRRQLISQDSEEMIEGYGGIIKKAREQLGLTQEDLARELKVKLSYIKKIESEKIEPSSDITRRLEKLLGIKLTTKVDAKEIYLKQVESPAEYVTLGDLLGLDEEE